MGHPIPQSVSSESMYSEHKNVFPVTNRNTLCIPQSEMGPNPNIMEFESTQTRRVVVRVSGGGIFEVALSSNDKS